MLRRSSLKRKMNQKRDKFLPRDHFATIRLAQLAASKRSSVASACGEGGANSKLMRLQRDIEHFASSVDWDKLEEDIDQLQELQAIVNRQNDDVYAAVLGRVMDLLENLSDTLEACNLK